MTEITTGFLDMRLQHDRQSSMSNSCFLIMETMRLHREINAVKTCTLLEKRLPLLFLCLFYSYSFIYIHFCLRISLLKEVSSHRCPRPTIANGFVDPGYSSYFHGTTVTYHCNTGYYLFGPTTRTCTSTGRWSGSLTHCLSK